MTSDPGAQPFASTARHPIAVVAERTRLSQDILRIWERRYAAISPARSASGERLYSEADIERLRLLTAAVGGGRRIGQVARLPTSELARLVEEDLAARRDEAHEPTLPDVVELPAVEDALAHVRALDARGLEALLRRTAAVAGVPAFLDGVVAPVLRRIGDEWHGGRLTIAHEHLASATIGAVVVELMSSMQPGRAAPRVVVATLAGNRHVIGAAMAGAAAAVEGWGVVYLGGDLPTSEIAAAAAASGARAVVLSVVYAENAEAMLGELRLLRELLPADVALLAGGGALVSARRGDARQVADGVEIGESLHALRRLLRRLAASSAVATSESSLAPRPLS